MIRRPRLFHEYSTRGHHFHVTTDGSPKPDPSGEGVSLKVPCPRCQKGKTLLAWDLDDSEARLAVCEVCGWWAYLWMDERI